MESALEISGVTKVYRRSHLGMTRQTVGVSELSLTVARGEVFGLLGLNGAGKTTTIKLILGLLNPTVGTISVLGQAMPERSVLARVGYLPEAAYLNRYLTGQETLGLFADISGMNGASGRPVVRDVLAKVGMQKFARKKLSEYSKGMLQRISIAQALLHDPELLIFDEPITGLDPLALTEIRQLILWLKAQGKTVFFSSHNISEVERVCDRIGIMVTGKLVNIISHSDWQGDRSLEKIFIETVRDSDSVGRLAFIP